MVSTNLLKQYELDSEIYFLDLSLDSVRRFSRGVTKFRQYSKFPTVTRDLAIVVDESISVGKIEEVIRVAAGDILGEIQLFDIYRGDQLENHKKSCAFSLEFVPQDKTLDQREILTVMERITESVSSTFNATLRQ
jgi:phenylalanyl-tRNA synthetase beta chain